MPQQSIQNNRGCRRWKKPQLCRRPAYRGLPEVLNVGMTWSQISACFICFHQAMMISLSSLVIILISLSDIWSKYTPHCIIMHILVDSLIFTLPLSVSKINVIWPKFTESLVPGIWLIHTQAGWQNRIFFFFFSRVSTCTKPLSLRLYVGWHQPEPVQWGVPAPPP